MHPSRAGCAAAPRTTPAPLRSGPAAARSPDRRRAMCAVPVEDRDPVAGVDEEGVVAAGTAGSGIEQGVAGELSAHRRRSPVGIAVRAGRLASGQQPALDRPHLLPGEGGAHAFAPLDRRGRGVRPVALQVGMAGGRARDDPVGIGLFLGAGRLDQPGDAGEGSQGKGGEQRARPPGARRHAPTPPESDSCAGVHTSAPRRTRRT